MEGGIMKEVWILLFALTTILLTGCQGNRNCPEPISFDSISLNIYDTIEREWELWNSMSQEGKMLSSHIPGCSRVKAEWYSTEDGHVEWIRVQGGYRYKEIRIVVTAMLYGDSADTKSSDSGWSVELSRQEHLANLDNAQLQVHSISTNNYFSNTAYPADGNIRFRFDVIGDRDAQSKVENTLDQVKAAFSEAF